MKPVIAYYITAHGMGHGVRSADIIRELYAAIPNVELHLISQLPKKFMQQRIGSHIFHHRHAAFDVGMVQTDSIRVDLDETLRQMKAICRDEIRLIQQERDVLKEIHADLVLCDIPSIPIVAAKQNNIPVIAIGNFTWNWIYEPLAAEQPEWNEVMAMFRRHYAQADLLLRLPFAEPMDAFPCQKEIPLLASTGQCDRQRIATATNAHPERSWVLLAFASMNWPDFAWKRLESMHEYDFFVMEPMTQNGSNLFNLKKDTMSFTDLVASCDIVLSKPGFGIVSECVANNKPFVYVERHHFPEYPILVEGIRRYLPHAHVPQSRFYEGDIYGALQQIPLSTPSQTYPDPAGSGVQHAVEEIRNALI
ncbi:MAG: hypothetical protein EOL87_16800 [Spartobacteria bacterium]|nr:hypothetical protein [Spartobacteria bacterium]